MDSDESDVRRMAAQWTVITKVSLITTIWDWFWLLGWEKIITSLLEWTIIWQIITILDGFLSIQINSDEADVGHLADSGG